MARVYCSHCGQHYWDIEVIQGSQNVKCPTCKKRTKINIRPTFGKKLALESQPY